MTQAHGACGVCGGSHGGRGRRGLVSAGPSRASASSEAIEDPRRGPPSAKAGSRPPADPGPSCVQAQALNTPAFTQPPSGDTSFPCRGRPEVEARRAGAPGRLRRDWGPGLCPRLSERVPVLAGSPSAGSLGLPALGWGLGGSGPGV
ncbi:collagen alpha-2(I) chain-like [Phyllostomus hastatus]|uniref:collagen alpha-2(I) chain-like n=1 Tax=Phyllostomus hastatus TaxID=9423 RepID=UPI001E67F77B|nr:collagen alpha-2(I) chain-like [Phyllostomus hastatus]